MTISKRTKEVKRLLDAINKDEREKIYSRGRIIPTSFRLNRKDRRHSGRVTPIIIHPQMKWKEIREEGLLPEEAYDDWKNYRDSQRREDRKDEKKRKLILLRKARKIKSDLIKT